MHNKKGETNEKTNRYRFDTIDGFINGFRKW